MAALAVLLIGAASLNLRTVLAVVGGAGPHIESVLDLSPAVLGSVSTISILGIAVGSAVGTSLARSLGLGRAAVVALAGTSLSLGLLMWEALAAVLISVALAGFFAGVLGALIPTVIRILLTPSHRGAGVAAMMVAMSIGTVTASLLVGWSAQHTSHWRAAVSVLFVVSAAVLVSWALAPTVRHMALTAASAPVTRGPLSHSRTRGVGHFISQVPPWVILLTLFVALQSALVFAQLAWLVPSLEAWGYSASARTWVFAVFSGLQLIGGALAPVLAARGHVRAVATIWGSALLVACGSLGLWLLATSASPLPALLAMTLVLAAGHGAVFAIANLLLSSYSDDASSTTRNTAVTMSVSQTLGAVGPVAIGTIVGAHGFTVSWTVLAAGAIALIGVGAMLARLLPTPVEGSDQ